MKNNPAEARVWFALYRASPFTYWALEDFLVYVDTVLRVVLTRFIISQSSLVVILELAKHLHVRIKKQTTAASLRLEQNRILSVILEIYGEGLRRKSRIIPSTLAAMAEVFILIPKKSL
jgi:hypothetical protein